MKGICLVLVIIAVTVDSKLTGLIWNILISTFIPANPTIPQQDEVQENDVKFFLYTRNNPDHAIQLLPDTFGQVDRKNPVKVIIHGWLESPARQWIRNMTKEYLKKDEYNIIQVDYSKSAAERYSVAVSHVGAVGAFVGKLIINLVINYGVPLSNFHIIGHSLGAQVSGAAGKEIIKLTNSKITRITALDAAAPLFETSLISVQGLTKSDANVVDAIHTDGGFFGYRTRIGHVDFYPNGGTPIQPGCPSLSIITSFLNGQEGLDELFCSHTRSYLYFISSINDGKFISTKCGSWDKFTSGNCNNNLKILMGDPYMYSPEATGKFYLRTNPNPPFNV